MDNLEMGTMDTMEMGTMDNLDTTSTVQHTSLTSPTPSRTTSQKDIGSDCNLHIATQIWQGLF